MRPQSLVMAEVFAGFLQQVVTFPRNQTIFHGTSPTLRQVTFEKETIEILSYSGSKGAYQENDGKSEKKNLLTGPGRI